MTVTLGCAASAADTCARTAGFGCAGSSTRHVRVLVGDPADGGQDAVQRRAPRLPAVRGDQHQPAAGIGRLGLRWRTSSRVARAAGPARAMCCAASTTVLPVTTMSWPGSAFGAQRVGGGLGRRQVQRRDPGHQLPVALLGERRGEVAGAQPGFEVHDRHLRARTRPARRPA